MKEIFKRHRLRSSATAILLLYATTFFTSAVNGQDTDITATLRQSTSTNPEISISMETDSAEILMGNVLDVRVTVSQSDDHTGIFDINENAMAPVELVKNSKKQLSKKETSDDTNVYEASYQIQAFDSGSYVLPQVIYIIGNDTAYSNEVALSVRPVNVTADDAIDTESPQIQYESRWYDSLPDWLTDNIWLIVGALVGALIITLIFMLLTKRIKIKPLPKKPAVPAHILAMRKLSDLKESRLWDPGNEKQFYTELTEILREYLSGRFGINAMEMTSAQIVEAIESREDTRLSKQHMQEVLELADYVKFARARTLREDNIRSFDNAVKFVESTRPLAAAEQPKQNS